MSTLKGSIVVWFSDNIHHSCAICFTGTVNSMVDQLSAFASEVTSVVLGVGMQGMEHGPT
jgi:hypothetical protein